MKSVKTLRQNEPNSFFFFSFRFSRFLNNGFGYKEHESWRVGINITLER